MNTFFTTTRITGLLYLSLAVTGMFTFLFAKSKLYVVGDAEATLALLASQQGLARLGIVAELALVGFQALAALWFFKLFRKLDSFAAISLASFGMVNAVAILISSAFWLTTLNGSLSMNPDAGRVLMLFDVHDAIWLVGQLFFGLWLIPMGYLAGLAKMPRFLGWVLVTGGIGYILATVLTILMPSVSPGLIGSLTIPATIGEFWMIGYLLVKNEKN